MSIGSIFKMGFQSQQYEKEKPVSTVPGGANTFMRKGGKIVNTSKNKKKYRSGKPKNGRHPGY